MNISNMNSNFVNTLFSSTNQSRQLNFDASMYTDIRTIKKSTFQHLFDKLGITADTVKPSYNNSANKDKVNSVAAAELKSAAGDLKASSAALSTSGSDSVFKKLTGTSSDKDVIEKAYVEGSLSTTKASVQVNVKQVAEAQQNAGNVINSADKTMAAGSYSFEIETGGKKSTLSFTVSKNDTNETMQQKLADTINKAGLGVTAKVNTANKQSYLSLTADKTGTDGAGTEKVFSISDKYGGSLVSTLGLDTTIQSAQNAVYSVNNGVDRVSKSNTVDLGGNAKAVLKGVSEGNVTIKFESDRSAITSSVKNFVNDFNDMLKTTEKYGFQSKSMDDLNGSLSSMSSGNRYALSSIGITVDHKGYISVDDEKLKNADVNKIKDIFSGAGSFASNVNNKASNVYNNANRYAQQSYSYYGKQQDAYSSAFAGGLYNSWF